MKVHLQVSGMVLPGYEKEALQQWEQSGLIPWAIRHCDGLMVEKKMLIA